MKTAGTIPILLRKLRSLSPLNASDVELLEALPRRIEEVPMRRSIVREGDIVSECCLLIEGYACRHKLAREGNRQIVSFHMPGDILDIQHLWFSTADHHIETVTAAVVAFIPLGALRDASLQSSRIGQALWRDAMVDASIFREWVLNVGRRDAATRLAHLLCEFACRHHAVGLGPVEDFKLPMTQQDLGDATGLTPVHVNRTLRVLEQTGLLEREGSRHVRILDWKKMQAFADFRPDYLHLGA